MKETEELEILKNLYEILNQPLDTSIVQTRQGGGGRELSYLPGSAVIDIANTIFGYKNWSIEVLRHTRAVDPEMRETKRGKKYMYYQYLCTSRLTVTFPTGDIKIVEGTGYGDGDLELAAKEAETDSLKRCFRMLGEQFGNGLYYKEGRPEALQTEEQKEETKTAFTSLVKAIAASQGIDVSGTLEECVKDEMDALEYTVMDIIEMGQSTRDEFIEMVMDTFNSKMQ